jgi:broad specificity phosphatase PhoE
MEVAKRVIAAVDEIGMRHCDESVLIVAHGISLAIITCLARGIPLDRLYAYVPDNAQLSYIEWKIPGHVCEFI